MHNDRPTHTHARERACKLTQGDLKYVSWRVLSPWYETWAPPKLASRRALRSHMYRYVNACGGPRAWRPRGLHVAIIIKCMDMYEKHIGIRCRWSRSVRRTNATSSHLTVAHGRAAAFIRVQTQQRRVAEITVRMCRVPNTKRVPTDATRGRRLLLYYCCI